MSHGPSGRDGIVSFPAPVMAIIITATGNMKASPRMIKKWFFFTAVNFVLCKVLKYLYIRVCLTNLIIKHQLFFYQLLLEHSILQLPAQLCVVNKEVDSFFPNYIKKRLSRTN